MAQPNDHKPFRVVIVGAGMVGLAFSHALQLANIDHVVLEKHSKIVSLHGAALTIFPGVARIFDQFGFLKKIQDSVTPTTSGVERWLDGTVNIKDDTFDQVAKMFEIPVVLFDGERCIAALYDNLPDQSFIEHTDLGVKVHFADGTVEEGDIVIGADGVHSIVRKLMWEYAEKNEPAAIPDSDKLAMYTHYKGIFGVSKFDEKLSSLGPADVHIGYGNDIAKLLFTQPGVAYWAMMWKDERSQPPKAYEPSLEEQEEVAQKYKDKKFTETITFGDLWRNRSRGGCLNIEEGVLDKWHEGRIVLVGDSAQKMTADLGIGANMAIESAIVLSNILQRETKDNKNHHFTASELSKLFAEYQNMRHERVSIFQQMSGDVLRMRSFETPWKKFFVSRIATMSLFKKWQTGKMMEGMAMAPKLEYVPTQTINDNAEGWKLLEKNEKNSSSGWLSYALLTSAVGVAISYAAVRNRGFLFR